MPVILLTPEKMQAGTVAWVRLQDQDHASW